MEQELAEVVDGVGDEGCDAEVVGARLSVSGCESGEINACEVKEGVFVVSAEILVCLRRGLAGGSGRDFEYNYLVIGGIYAVECGMHFCLDRVKRIQN